VTTATIGWTQERDRANDEPLVPAAVAAQAERRESQAGQIQEQPRPRAEQGAEPAADESQREEAGRRPFGGRARFSQFLQDIQRQIAELEERLAQARERGESTEELQRALSSARERLRNAMRNMGQARERLQARIGELQQALQRARSAGQNEEVRAIERELDEITRQMQQLERTERPGVEGDERAQRLAHLQQAIEHLHAAGLHDQAERLTQYMRQMAEGPREEGRPEGRPEDRPPFEGPRFPPEPGPFGPAGQMPRIIQGLREEMQQLRREVEELRQILREQIGSGRRPDRPEQPAEPGRRREPRPERPDGQGGTPPQPVPESPRF